MHKYQPRVHIIKKKDHTASLLNLKSEEFRTFIFQETVFTAVTAYQNQLVSSSSYKNEEVITLIWYSSHHIHNYYDIKIKDFFAGSAKKKQLIANVFKFNFFLVLLYQ